MGSKPTNRLGIIMTTPCRKAYCFASIKLIFVISIFIVSTFIANAYTLSPEDALNRALSSSGKTGSKIRGNSKRYEFALAVNADDSNTPEVYLYDASDNGYLVLSADDAAVPVLGYSDNGNISSGEMPEPMKYWLQSIANEIAYAKANKIPMKAAESVGSAIEPLVKSKWNQSYPYNIYTPVVNGSNAPTGCVATAVAQIMNYHQWPAAPTGTGFAKDTNGNEYEMSFDGITFDWDKMQNSLDYYSPQESIEAVATLMKCAGYGVYMNYGATESRAYSKYVAHYLPSFFNYSSGISHVLRTGFSRNQWEEILYYQLSRRLPIYYAGGAGNLGSGHAFICDGYDGNGYFHFNWGWGGHYDGYYLVSNLTPGGAGIGGNINGYNYDQDIIINIFPNDGNDYDPQDLVSGNIRFYNNVFDMSFGRKIYSSKDFEVGLNISSETNDFFQTLTIGNFQGSGQSTKSLDDGIISQLDQNTKYYVKLYWRPSNDANWSPILYFGGGLVYKIYGDIIGGTLYFENGEWKFVSEFLSSAIKDISISSVLSFDNSSNILKGYENNMDVAATNNTEDYAYKKLTIHLNDISSNNQVATISTNLELEPNFSGITQCKIKDINNVPEGVYWLSIYDTNTNELLWQDNTKYFNVVGSSNIKTVSDGIYKYISVSKDDTRLIGTASGYVEAGDVAIPPMIDVDGEYRNVTSITCSFNQLFTLVSSLEIGAYIKVLPSDALSGFSRMTKLVLPESLMEIHENALGGCENLHQIICYAKEPPAINSNSGIDLSNIYEYVPLDSKAKYEADSKWSGGYRIIGLEKPYMDYDINLSTASLEINKGETTSISYQTTPSIENPDVVIEEVLKNGTPYSIASISKGDNGSISITANESGTSTISVKHVLNGKISECILKVIQPATSVSISESELTMEKGTSTTLTSTVGPEDANDKSVSWSSTDENIATVDSEGKVTATGVGECDITATSHNGLTASCHVKVFVNPAGITMSETSKEMHIGNTFTLTATVTPEDAADKSVTWTSSNTEVASVDAEGQVSATGLGETTITATTANGISATCTIKVLPILVESLAISATTIEGNVGEQIELSVSATPDNATDKSVSWSSDNAEVASVSESGVVTLNKRGTATITATATDGSGKSATCAVTVNQPATSISVSESEVTIEKGSSATITANVGPEDANDKSVAWTSSNTEVASVDAEGKVTAKGVGECDITATSHNGLTASCHVKVFVNPAGITMSETSKEMHIGDTFTLTATVTPEEAADKSVTWTSSNTEVASVDAEGKVTANGLGETTITATTANGISAISTVKVLPILVESFTMSATTIEGNVGEQITLSVTATPDNVTSSSVSWSSDNAEVASVSESGVVTLNKRGTATITATATDGSGKSATCGVTVNQPATSISVSETEVTIEKGSSATITANVGPEDANDKSVAWTSTDESIASVDSEGKVTANGVGECDIVATSHNGLTASCHVKVVVTPILVESIELSQTNVEAEQGTEVQLTATVYPENATNAEITWSSSDESIATVDGTGKITILATGTATITASATDGSEVTAVCEISATSDVEMVITEGKMYHIYNYNGILLKKNAGKEDIDALERGTYIITDGTRTMKMIK